MKKIILFISLITITFTDIYAETKMAVVNPIEIFNDSNIGSLSLKKLENTLKPQATKLKQEQNNIMKEMKALQENYATMTQQELDQKKLQIQKKDYIFREKAMVIQKKESESKDQLSKKFQDAFDRSVNTIAKQKGYNIVLTTQSLAFVDDIDDISNDVIRLMNKEY